MTPPEPRPSSVDCPQTSTEPLTRPNHPHHTPWRKPHERERHCQAEESEARMSEENRSLCSSFSLLRGSSRPYGDPSNLLVLLFSISPRFFCYTDEKQPRQP
ncbi:hypothetical protein DPEC_G00087690 [Dallia pectoralis]|uniref:Uncharacterized protein n=1 Tax=Dallia pectoralis TaxID=75939 RepID=A0ACC2H0I6_DALPE|nr:hypothetical protein DPEC_G00087690 [Dallia pectoralis]